MLDLDDIAIDLEAEVQGTWVRFAQDTRVKLARYGNPDHDTYIQKLRAPYLTGKLTQQDIPDEVAEMILNKSLAYCLIKDWQGLTRGGEAVQFTPETALQLFQDRKYKTFRDQCVYECQEIANFRELAIRGMEENSGE